MMNENSPRIGAVIAAAGMSSRMKDFKQLMKVGGVPMAERVVRSFQQAGVRDVVMVTGCRAEEVEEQLSGLGIVFLRNPEYADSDMFDSAKIGFSYLEGRCSRVFFCPSDIPLFQESTLQKLLQSEADLVIPSRNRKAGHPILIDAAWIPEILNYSGEQGLKGALASLPLRKEYVEVQDEGIILDADTKEEYEKLEELYVRGRQQI